MFNEFKEALASGDFAEIVRADLGIIILMAIVIAIFFLVLVVVGKDESQGRKVKPLVYSGMSIALAMALSNIQLFQMPQGGSITAFSMLFVIVVGYFFGLRQGVLAGIVYGLLQLVFKPYVVHPAQLLLDYPLAFGALGLAGVFANSKFGLLKGVLLGTFARLVMHVLSGAIFFAEYAGEMNPWIYSFTYNFSYLAVEAAVTIVLILVPGVMSAFSHVKRSATVQ